MPSKPLKAIKPMFDKGKWRILRGDMVQIMAGRERGLVGRVLRVIRDERFPRVIVEGRNMVRCLIMMVCGGDGFVCCRLVVFVVAGVVKWARDLVTHTTNCTPKRSSGACGSRTAPRLRCRWSRPCTTQT
jgi:hypothetical protein